MFISGLVFGVLAYFILARIIDTISHRHAMTIKYDCTCCKYRCNGYHCYVMRQEIADYHKKGDLENEVSDISGEDCN